ncbi:MAG: BrnA antitoxin family protein [Pseudomonadota bacterium]
MKRERISKPMVFSEEMKSAAIAAASDHVHDPQCPYDPNDPAAVAAFWAKGKLRLPGQRGPQKHPTKVAITVRYSPEVVEFFKATGDGWQCRMNEALLAYVNQHSEPARG